MDKNDAEDVPEALLKVAEGSARFTTSLYKAVAKKDGNVFISPISVEVVLALAYMGAAGNTAEQIASVLHLPTDREDVKAGFLSLLGLLKSTENLTLEIANKVFSQSGYGILPEYRAVAEESFLSAAEELDFADGEGSRKVINSWVEAKTKNKIRDLIPSGVLDEMTRLVLVNAVYFKGLWEKQFNADNTAVKKFHLNSKESKDVHMMYKKDKFGYLQSQELDADILQMHYKGRSISMFIILPHDIDGISELENKLAGVDISKILTRLPVREVEVSVPKFKLEETTGLNDILTELGMRDMFIAREADFSGISGKQDLCVSSVLQKAFVEVNEEGSEAAAATECPEEEYDHRSLYERLEEQKQKRELEYEEAHRLKNMIKGLDDDEVEFLDLVDRSKLEEERRKSAEEAREMKDFRDAVATLQERSLEQRIHTEIRSRPPTHSGTSSGRSSQVRLLAGAVVRKRPADGSTQDASNKKPCAGIRDGMAVSQDVNSTESSVTPAQNFNVIKDTEDTSRKRKNYNEDMQNGDSTAVGLQCIGILPGLGLYPDSSDSEQSSDTDQELGSASNYDLVGRKIPLETKSKSASSSGR